MQCLKMLLAHPQVKRVRGDMCPHGMKSEDEAGIGRVLQPTGWATNSECIADAVSEKCSNMHGGERWHRQVQLLNGRAAACQVCLPKLCTTILKGFRAQLEKDSRC